MESRANINKFLGALGVFLAVVIVTWGAVGGNMAKPAEKTVKVELLGSEVQKISDTEAKNSPYVKNTGTVPCYVRIRVDSDSPELTLGNMPWGKFEAKEFSANEEEFWIKSGSYYYYKNLSSGDTLLPGMETPKLFTAVNSAGGLEGAEIGVIAEAMDSEKYVSGEKAWAGLKKS